jgi:2-dehydro-3-deoxyphosphogluconate aldolase / (4S)-4-hydroxy-2-oxoglutarate aldolase
VTPPSEHGNEEAGHGASGEAFLLGRNPLIAIVRFAAGGALVDVVGALAAGGIDVAEITIDTPGALAAVKEAVAAGYTVGVGTVVTAEQVRASARAGASFVVSPGLVAEVVQEALACGIEPIPGVFTGTEVLAAVSAGARLLKLFPAAAVGERYLRALRGPFPHAAFVPTGGIALSEIRGYLDAGATAVALGSQLVGHASPSTAEGLAELTTQAALATRHANQRA